MRGQIGEAGGVRSEVRPPVDVAEGVGAAREWTAFIIMGEELGFVGGYVDAYGAFSFASLAGEAEIKRLLDRKSVV